MLNIINLSFIIYQIIIRNEVDTDEITLNESFALKDYKNLKLLKIIYVIFGYKNVH